MATRELIIGGCLVVEGCLVVDVVFLITIISLVRVAGVSKLIDVALLGLSYHSHLSQLAEYLCFFLIQHSVFFQAQQFLNLHLVNFLLFPLAISVFLFNLSSFFSIIPVFDAFSPHSFTIEHVLHAYLVKTLFHNGSSPVALSVLFVVLREWVKLLFHLNIN